MENTETGQRLYAMILEKAAAENITTYDIRGPHNPFPVTYQALYNMRVKGIIGPKLAGFIRDYIGIEVTKTVVKHLTMHTPPGGAK